jgi:hypothetical protein
MEFLAAKKAALRRQRLGDAAADIVEAHTPPVVVNETKQRAQQARNAAAKRAERQNTFVAGVLASAAQEVIPQPQKKPAAICPHEKRRYYCVECEGAGTCQHKRTRRNCRDCCRELGKGNYCRHDIWRRNCCRCTPEAAWRKGWWILNRPGTEAKAYLQREYERERRESSEQGAS